MSVLFSTLILGIIILGLVYRHQPKKHVPLMLTAFALDVALVLYIELSRDAIHTFSESLRTPFEHQLLLFHIAVSVLTLVLYVVLTATGFKVLKGRGELLKLHRNLAGLFVLARLVNYATSFWVGT